MRGGRNESVSFGRAVSSVVRQPARYSILQRASPLNHISGNTMPRTNGAIPIDIVQHAPGVIHVSVVESVAAIPPLGSFMLSRCPIQDKNAANPPS